jgi:hypothetical protein
MKASRTESTAQCPRCLASFPAETLVKPPRRGARWQFRAQVERACPLPTCGYTGPAADFTNAKVRRK